MNKQNQNFNFFKETGLGKAFTSKVKAELESLHIDSEKSKNIVYCLDKLIQFEKKILAKLASKNDEFLKFYTNSEIGQKIFHIHEKLVTEAFGPQVDFIEFKLNEQTKDSLSKHLKKIGVVRYDDFLDLKQTSFQNDPLFKIIFNKDKIKALDENMTLLNYKNTELNKSLLSVLREEISKHVKSPFAFINTRAWRTKPGAERHGPNEEHLDGFNSGHMKIMIYLTPMSIEFGYFTILGQKIIDRKPGTVVLFKNSDIIHSGIPGTKFPRICIEITLQRTLLNSTQTHDGHPIGRHNYCITSTYNGGTLEL